MATVTVEERLTAVEEQLAQLKQLLAATSPPAELPWLGEDRRYVCG